MGLPEWKLNDLRLLANAIREVRSHSHILCVDVGRGRLVHMTWSIADKFRDFYRDLYNSTAHSSALTPIERQTKIHQFLTEPGPTKISVDDSIALVDPITTEEWYQAPKVTCLNEAPGPDRFTLHYFKSFAKILEQPFTAGFNSILEGSSCLIDTLRATITVILKEGKDPMQCKNYHPISLLNVDFKLITKMLVTRLQLQKLTQSNQVGFYRKGKLKTIQLEQ